MGMAASQARYLALVARKSNCEYEGQQINQARLALSNQSANLFNQMLGLTVPVPPSTQDYTTKQYSFSDGVNAVTIDSWKQLATKDENYNYVVTYHYNADVYTGSQKKLNDPQVQFKYPSQDIPTDYTTQVSIIQNALVALSSAQDDYDEANNKYQSLLNSAKSLSTYADRNTYTGITQAVKDSDSQYTITNADGDTVFTQYDATTDVNVAAALETLKQNGAISEDIDLSTIFVNGDNFVFKSDLDSLIGLSGTSTILPLYHYDDETPEGQNWVSTSEMETQLQDAVSAMNTAKTALDLAQLTFDSLDVPSYIGNCKLTPISKISDDQAAEITQIIKDMNSQEVSTNLDKYYNIETGEYTGGIYSFTLNGYTYYTTYDDLADSARSGTGINHIDDQQKLAYYRADYVSTKIEKTEKALLETDANGRFTSIRLEDDTVKYNLTVETITDEAAYEDAMNQYYYENNKYDKMVQDINAKTSLIHQEDKQLELRLKQLETEQNALKTEMEAVQKIVKDNVEDTFKTFNN